MLSYREYLEFAQQLVSLAEEKQGTYYDTNIFLIPAIILAWSAIESFTNNILDDFGSLPESLFELHERAFLLEKRIKLIERGINIGSFTLDGTEYRKLEDKITFLIKKFGQSPQSISKGDVNWQNFMDFKQTRDRLVHPRRDKDVTINIPKVKKFIKTSEEVIQLVALNVWKKKIEF